MCCRQWSNRFSTTAFNDSAKCGGGVPGFVGFAGRACVLAVDLSVAVNDRRVVAAAEGAADFFVAGAGELAGQENDDRAGEHDRLPPRARFSAATCGTPWWRATTATISRSVGRRAARAASSCSARLASLVGAAIRAAAELENGAETSCLPCLSRPPASRSAASSESGRPQGRAKRDG